MSSFSLSDTESAAAAQPRSERGFTLWFTGMSGAGKSTVSTLVAARLRALRRKVEVLDGDVVRTHLSKGLTFSKEDRDTNVLRIGFVCHLLARNGVIAITAAISPYREIREQVRQQNGDFVEVFARCSLDALVQRDVKGLYARALAGEIPHFTGISDPYEEPLNPDVVFDSDRETPEQSAQRVLESLQRLGYLAAI